MLNYNHLHYFHVTAAEGSVARAAERLGVGQPTVSEQIRQLERSLATPLFERVGGKLKLTEAGRAAFEHTSVMFRASERLVESLTGSRKAPPPVSLRVGLASGVARAVATDFLLPVFAIDDCVPIIRTGESHELLRDLRAHELDLLICESDPGVGSRPDLQLVPIDRPRLVCVTAANVADERWEDVALVHYRPISVFRFPVDSYLDERNLHPRVAAETDDAAMMLAAVQRGGFAAFVPWSVAREAVTAGKVRVIAEIKPDHVSIYALYHDVETATVARRAVELLVEYSQQDRD